jgi:mono/diheme cytochrome c family protein
VSRRIPPLLIGFAVACQVWPGPTCARQAAAESEQQALVAEGERLWTQSPDPSNPVACVTCHHDPAKTRGWAASFPKFKPLPPPHARVMTLLQANAEAVERHYRLADPLPAATAITAYLTSHGADVPISPGISAGQPVFPARMQALASSVVRGERAYARSCGHCHKPFDLAPSATAFPRAEGGCAESLEVFLDGHRPLQPSLAWDGQATADIMAYLMSQAASRPNGHHTYQASTEGKEGP